MFGYLGSVYFSTESKMSISNRGTIGEFTYKQRNETFNMAET